jgi:hypothetical protein
MAIGSAPEIGVQFTTWGKMSPESRLAWFTYIRENWNDNLMNGYATLVPTPNIQQFNQKEGYE